MKKIQFLSVVFSLILFAGITAGATAFAEPGKYNHAEKMNAYCDMSDEQQAELIAKHNKSEDKVTKMNEYCSLDDEGRTAFIEEHKDAYKNHGDKKHKITKKLLKNLSDEQRTELKSDFKSLKAEFQALKTQLETDGELSKDQKRDLRMQFIEKARAIQLSWITPQN